MSASACVKPLRILLVENHADTLDSLTLYLRDAGHVVHTCMTLAQATALLEKVDCNFVLCDIGLPDGSGLDLLKKTGLPPFLFAVAMSGFGMNIDTVRSREAGFRHHLLKPFKAAELDKILAEASEELG